VPNGNERGSSYTRRARKAWLLSPAAGWGGDGIDVPCWTCGVLVGTDLELFADRLIPACQGGTYRRDNIAPHCALCSHRQGQAIMRARRTQAASATWLAGHLYLASCPA
jgi:hypothetical protein